MSEQEILDFFAHRSGHEAYQYCDRRRYLNYAHLGTGINQFPPIWFDVGSVEHIGLGSLLQAAIDEGNDIEACLDIEIAHDCIRDIDEAFRASQIWGQLGVYEQNEQLTLLAGLFWAFWFRAWPTFIRTFEILMVEPPSQDTYEFTLPSSGAPARLHVLSRPDAIVRSRLTGEIVAINWKTINSLQDQRRQNIVQSLQVALESHYAEQLYAKWLESEWSPQIPSGLKGRQLQEFLDAEIARYKSLPAEVSFTQIVYLVKGARKLTVDGGEESENVDEQYYLTADKNWRQESILCYRWLSLDPSTTQAPSAWSYHFYKADNKTFSKLTPQKNWIKQAVWEIEQSGVPPSSVACYDTIRDWVQSLNSGEIWPSPQNKYDERNQANPLDKIIVFEEPIPRDHQNSMEMLEAMIDREIRIADRLVTLRETPPDKFDEALNILFPRQLISCRKPTCCEFDGKLCNVPIDAREPLFQILPEKGIWQKRLGHHAAEIEALKRGQ